MTVPREDAAALAELGFTLESESWGSQDYYCDFRRCPAGFANVDRIERVTFIAHEAARAHTARAWYATIEDIDDDGHIYNEEESPDSYKTYAEAVRWLEGRRSAWAGRPTTPQ